MLNQKKQNGFTLLELLIVVVIIIILAGISFIALNGQRAKARDAQRISDVKQIRTALEFYFSNEGEYPLIENEVVIGSQDRERLCSKNDGSFVSAQTTCNQDSIYMSTLPTDPLSGQEFTYTGSAEGYDISFELEKQSALGPPGVYNAHSEVIDSNPGNR